MASILIGFIFWFMQKEYGTLAASVSALALALYPLFLGESHFNLKDIPETVFYSLTALSYFLAVVNKKKKWMIIASIFFGLGLGTKFNILFLPIILFLWTIIFLFYSRRSIMQYLKFFPILLVFPVISVFIFIISWPYLWQSPISRIIETFSFYKSLGISTTFDPRYIFLSFNTYAAQWISYTTPLITLFFSFFGIAYALTKGWKEQDKKALLLFLWFIIPIARVTTPSAGIYGGVRQLMEFVPAMAMLAGIGAFWLHSMSVSFLKKRTNNSFLKKKISLIFGLLIILSFLPIALKLISIHPNENVYFNPIVGGLKGAEEKNIPYWGNSFGNTYRQAINWINANVPKNSTLVLSQELMPNLPSILVRNDLTYTNTKRSGYFKYGEYVIGLNYGSPLNRIYYSSRYYNRTLDPIYQIQVDKTSILNIWKNDINHTKKDYLREAELTDINHKITDNGILFDLKRNVFLSRIDWQFSSENCRKLTLGYFKISQDNDNWIYTPHNLPDETPIPIVKPQPDSNSLSYPFGSEYGRYIFFHAEPTDSCVKQILSTQVHYYPDALIINQK